MRIPLVATAVGLAETGQLRRTTLHVTAHTAFASESYFVPVSAHISCATDSMVWGELPLAREESEPTCTRAVLASIPRLPLGDSVEFPFQACDRDGLAVAHGLPLPV